MDFKILLVFFIAFFILSLVIIVVLNIGRTNKKISSYKEYNSQQINNLENASSDKKANQEDFTISSPDFGNGESIPDIYTCKGKEIIPTLLVSNPPDKTKSFALILIDPDAPRGDFTHWIFFNISGLNFKVNVENQLLLSQRNMPIDGVNGVNDFGSNSYRGPCPPIGEKHRYFFKIFALDSFVDLSEGASNRDLENAMKGYILREAEFYGNYEIK